MTISPERAHLLLDAIPGRRILVVGDLMLDRYVYGRVERISPEAPVPVVHVTRDEEVTGGASNVAVNVQALGGVGLLSGVVGPDRAGDSLLDLLRAQGVDLSAVLQPEGVATIVKTRVVADRQQVVRVDREQLCGLAGATLEQLAETAAAAVANSDAVILEDYGKGALVQPVVDAVIGAARRRGVPVGYDPKEDHVIVVKGITMASPNRHEAFKFAGMVDKHSDRHPLEDPSLLEVAKRLNEAWEPDWLLITLGPQGTLLVEDGKPTAHVPTRAREVFDVSGAGDTVIATCLLALAAGATPGEAAELSNHAAGVVVGKLGTATCSLDELRAAVSSG